MSFDFDQMLQTVKDRQWSLADIDWQAPGAETMTDALDAIASKARTALSAEFAAVATIPSNDVEPALGISVFNKEPILLMNRTVVAIPPVNDPNGHALLFNLPLYDRESPNAEPRAYLTSLRYGADHYLTEKEAAAFRE